MSIRIKIIIPFVLIFILTLGIFSFFAIKEVVDVVRDRQISRVHDIMVAVRGMPINKISLMRLENVMNCKLLHIEENRNRIAYPELNEENSFTEIYSYLKNKGEYPEIGKVFIIDKNEYLLADIETENNIDKSTILAFIPVSDISLAQWTAIRPIAIGSGVGILFMIIAGVIIANRITKPIRNLAEASNKFGEGKHVVVDVQTTDETGDLAKAFKHMVESLEDAQEKLVKAEKLSVLGKVAAGVAHEIKNPLAAIKMTIQVLQNRASKKEEDTKPYETISQEIDRLSIYIGDLLDFANPSEMEVSEVDLTEILESILHIMERQLQHSNIEVKKEIPENLPVIQGDKNRIRQIIMNLILNAQQAMAPSGTLRIKAESTGESVKLLIADSANKLPTENLSKIFEPFYSSKEGGTGLGLALVKKFTEQHGGSIDVRSDNAESVFVVSFPINIKKKNGV